MFKHFRFQVQQILIRIEAVFSGTISKYVEPAITVLNEVKKAIDNPTVDFIAEIAKIPFVPEVKAFLDKAIPEAIIALKIVDLKPTLSDPSNPNSAPIPLTANDYLKSLLVYLQSLSAPAQSAILVKVASLMVKASHGDMTEAVADTLVQNAYIELKTKAAGSN